MKKREDDFIITLAAGAVLGSIATLVFMAIIRVFLW